MGRHQRRCPCCYQQPQDLQSLLLPALLLTSQPLECHLLQPWQPWLQERPLQQQLPSHYHQQLLLLPRPQLPGSPPAGW